MKLTRKQREAVLRKYRQDPDGAKSYREFRKRIDPIPFYDGAVALPWCGMILCIEGSPEHDGLCHS